MKYNADLAKCLEELTKSITELENLGTRIADDISWFKKRLEDDTINTIEGVEPMSAEEKAKIEQDLAEAVGLQGFVSNITTSVLSHSISISDKLLNKEAA
ncbi:MAG: hypothetical protein J5608_02390 [Alphaproteobacteria bacterium]|nr:hypothetical protein [Alphaproteobacteria bacterium]